MSRFAHLIASLSAVSAFGFRVSNHIIDGTVVTDPLEYSFFALLAHGNTWAGCGASIINATHGVSAAHCFGGGDESACVRKDIDLWVGEVTLDNFTITAGGTDRNRGTKIQAEVTCHPDFDGKCSHGHDIALLKLKDPLKLPSFVKPVPLALDQGAQIGEVVTSVGFGLTEKQGHPDVIGEVSKRLRQVQLNVFKQESQGCAHVYAHGYGCSDKASEDPATPTSLDQQFCAGDQAHTGKDTCSGDSGSPVVVTRGSRVVQVGIVSYGGGPGGNRGQNRICGSEDWPGIYSQVSSFKDWLEH